MRYANLLVAVDDGPDSTVRLDLACKLAEAMDAALMGLGAGAVPPPPAGAEMGGVLSGDLAAVGALFAWTGYLVMSKRSSGRMTSMEYTLGTGFWTAAVSLPVGLIAGQDMSIPAASECLVLTVLVVVGGGLGHSMMNWALTRIPLWLGSIVTLMIPVVSSLTAWVFLGEALDTLQVVAIVGVVVALAAVVTGQQSPASGPDPAAPLASGTDTSAPGAPAGADRERA